jgi:hypothetical protein
VNPETTFEALHTNYVVVGVVIRNSIDFGLFFGPGLTLALIGWGCSDAWDRWRDWRWRRAAVMRRLDELAAERNPDQDLEDIRAMWAIKITDTREEEPK